MALGGVAERQACGGDKHRTDFCFSSHIATCTQWAASRKNETMRQQNRDATTRTVLYEPHANVWQPAREATLVAAGSRWAEAREAEAREAEAREAGAHKCRPSCEPPCALVHTSRSSCWPVVEIALCEMLR